MIDYHRLADELAPVLNGYRIQPPVVDAKLLKRRKQIRESMAKIRNQRRASGLNAVGHRMLKRNLKFVAKKWRND